MREWIDVARITKKRNSEGSFVVRCTAGLPFLLKPKMQVCFVPPATDVPRTATVLYAEKKDEATGEVRFEGIGDNDIMQALVGTHCLIRRDAVEGSILDNASWKLDGWTVMDRNTGIVGQVETVICNPGQDLLQVARPEGGECLIPLVEDLINDIDEDRCEIIMDLPKGILDL